MLFTTGSVMLDLLGTEITPEERELLQHPLVGGVILFTRNYASVPQIKQLCEAIRHSRPTPLLIAVDQEGGRVQRFREGFTRLPPMSELGKLYDISPEKALKTAESTAEIMATELRKVGVDISFAPVLDLDKGINSAIGDRAFHHDPIIVARLAGAFIRGMRYRDVPERDYDFVFIDGPHPRAPSDGSISCDFDFIYQVLRAKNNRPLRAMIDRRTTTGLAIQALFGRDKVRYDYIGELGFVGPCRRSDLTDAAVSYHPSAPRPFRRRR